MSRRWALLGAVVGLAVLVAAIAAALVRIQATSARSQLSAAIAVTGDARGYVTSDSKDPGETTVFNAPDLYETIDHGAVTNISAGDDQFSAVPARCASGLEFVENRTAGGASFNVGPPSDEDVRSAGNVFTASRAGRVVARYEVRDGRLVALTRIFRPPGARPETVTTSYEDIDHAPKIVVPSGRQVAVSPTVYLNGCPLATGQ